MLTLSRMCVKACHWYREAIRQLYSTCAQQVEAVDIVQEGDVPHDQGGAPAEAVRKAGRRAHDTVDTARATIRRHCRPDARARHLTKNYCCEGPASFLTGLKSLIAQVVQAASRV